MLKFQGANSKEWSIGGQSQIASVEKFLPSREEMKLNVTGISAVTMIRFFIAFNCLCVWQTGL
jgi:hypothetical protein